MINRPTMNIAPYVPPGPLAVPLDDGLLRSVGPVARAHGWWVWAPDPGRPEAVVFIKPWYGWARWEEGFWLMPASRAVLHDDASQLGHVLGKATELLDKATGKC